MVNFIEDLLATNKNGWKKKLHARKNDIDKVFPKWGGVQNKQQVVENER